MIILDTNVISEFMKTAPSAAVMKWLDQYPQEELYLTTITEAEIKCGIALLPTGKRKTALEKACAEVLEIFEKRILPFDRLAAQAYGEIVRTRQRKGLPISQLDAQIASIAKAQKAVLATRNVKDFQSCGIKILNPWE